MLQECSDAHGLDQAGDFTPFLLTCASL